MLRGRDSSHWKLSTHATSVWAQVCRHETWLWPCAPHRRLRSSPSPGRPRRASRRSNLRGPTQILLLTLRREERRKRGTLPRAWVSFATSRPSPVTAARSSRRYAGATWRESSRSGRRLRMGCSMGWVKYQEPRILTGSRATRVVRARLTQSARLGAGANPVGISRAPLLPAQDRIGNPVLPASVAIPAAHARGVSK
jgi:hypothetical protein